MNVQGKDNIEKKDSFLSDKVNNLVESIGSEYGELLLDELFRRLDYTIKDFNKEIKELFVSLKKDEDKKQSVIGLMKKGKTITKESKNKTELLSDWEIKLAEIEKGD
ncbi:MAG: hypothetical protein CMG00_05155 [Candidatus Marinimicrobia bacterium]|nr:hypothetical protein [Candidatus Neomarinimicrobiota bacterium]|tara:strand:- start:1728 stop:2048 length:321 start_codon:yes stop_codon:yes gene_type:complete